MRHMPIADRSICNYFCFDTEKRLHYIAINAYRDLFGDKYAKPLYIEEKPYIKKYLFGCKRTIFQGIPYISLIKDENNRYRLNKQIYSDCVSLLSLKKEDEASLAFKLLEIPKHHIRKIILPSYAFKEARKSSSLIRKAINKAPSEMFDTQIEIGLVGSTAFDPSHISPDIDLVFSGEADKIKKIYKWFRRSRSGSLAPLQRRLKRNDLLLCAFFALENQYPFDATSLRIQKRSLTREKIKIVRNFNFCYMNLQCYEVLNIRTKSTLKLWVRDTLGRCVLNPGDEVILDAYQCEYHSEKVLLITDVEQQLHGKKVHFEK